MTAQSVSQAAVDRLFPVWMLLGLGVSVWQVGQGALAIAALSGLAALTWRARGEWNGLALGWANALTWLRIGMTASLPLLASYGYWLAAMALVIFALDGVDGAIARALGTSSDFGAALDKECDAFFVVMLSLLLWHLGHAGAWVLVAGLWRYVYSLIVALGAELKPAPRSNWGRYSYSTACVCLVLALVPSAVSWVLALIATLAVSVSFLRSLFYSLPRS